MKIKYLLKNRKPKKQTSLKKSTENRIFFCLGFKTFLGFKTASFSGIVVKETIFPISKVNFSRIVWSCLDWAKTFLSIQNSSYIIGVLRYYCYLYRARDTCCHISRLLAPRILGAGLYCFIALIKYNCILLLH